MWCDTSPKEYAQGGQKHRLGMLKYASCASILVDGMSSVVTSLFSCNPRNAPYLRQVRIALIFIRTCFTSRVWMAVSDLSVSCHTRLLLSQRLAASLVMPKVSCQSIVKSTTTGGQAEEEIRLRYQIFLYRICQMSRTIRRLIIFLHGMYQYLANQGNEIELPRVF